MDNCESLRKAAEIARIKLTPQESERLVGEIDEVLRVFSKIDGFKDLYERGSLRDRDHGSREYVEEPKMAGERKMRSDKAEKCDVDPFSNSKLIKNRKFIGPRLVD